MRFAAHVGYLLMQCGKRFGWERSIQKSQSFLNGDIEYQINVSEVPLENFGKDFFIQSSIYFEIAIIEYPLVKILL